MSYILYKFRPYKIAAENYQIALEDTQSRQRISVLDQKLASEENEHLTRFSDPSLPIYHVVHHHILRSYTHHFYLVHHRYSLALKAVCMRTWSRVDYAARALPWRFQRSIIIYTGQPNCDRMYYGVTTRPSGDPPAGSRGLTQNLRSSALPSHVTSKRGRTWNTGTLEHWNSVTVTAVIIELHSRQTSLTDAPDSFVVNFIYNSLNDNPASLA